MSDNTSYVYEHWRPDTGVCFYVGKGKRTRAWNMKGRNVWHTSITSKLTANGFCVDVRMVAVGLSDKDALVLEMERIAFWGRKNLCNMSDGGDAGHNRTFTKTHRQNLKKAWKRSPEAIKKMTSGLRLVKGHLGKKHSASTKEKLRNLGLKNSETFKMFSHLGPSANAKKVICIDDEREFESASSAGRFYGIDNTAIIGVCRCYKHRKTAGGKRFKYKEAS